MDFKLTVAQRHIDAFCESYSMPPQEGGQSDERYATDKEQFTIDKILGFIEEVTKSYYINFAMEAFRIEKAEEAKKFEAAAITEIT